MQKNTATEEYYVVLGLGVTGLSVARFFKNRNIHFVVMDSRTNPSGALELERIAPSVPCYFGDFTIETEKLLRQAVGIVISPGVPRQLPAVEDARKAGVEVVGDIELFMRENKKPVIGITGSNGKTTVTSMVGEACKLAGIKACVAGNIGKPVLDCLEENHELYVLELSSFQLESMCSGGLAVACILNISEDHMDRYSSLEDYRDAKHRIYNNAKSVVYNFDDNLTWPGNDSCGSRFAFSMVDLQGMANRYVYEADKQVLFINDSAVMGLAELKMVGLHNVANALAVLAICDAALIKRDAALNVLRQFRGLPHRCEWVADINGVAFINDSKATNVGAAEAALEGLSKSYTSIVMIVGGESKGADFSQFAERVNNSVTTLVLIGRDAEQIAKHVSGDISKYYARSMAEAVSKAFESSQPGGAVLLSPACASFDMFSGYEDRGQRFREAVEALVT